MILKSLSIFALEFITCYPQTYGCSVLVFGTILHDSLFVMMSLLCLPANLITMSLQDGNVDDDDGDDSDEDWAE